MTSRDSLLLSAYGQIMYLVGVVEVLGKGSLTEAALDVACDINDAINAPRPSLDEAVRGFTFGKLPDQE